MQEKFTQPTYPINFDFVMECGAFRLFLPIDGVDRLGRSILEGRSIKHLPSPNDYRICPYPGSRFRHEKTMNIGALGHFMSCRADAESYVALLSHAVADCSFSLIGEGRYKSAYRLLQTSYTAFKAPLAWLILVWSGKGVSPPPEVAAVAKISEGIFEIALRIIHETPTGFDRMTPKMVHDYAESGGGLIGLKEVCAGSPKLIEDFLAVILSNETDKRPVSSIYNVDSCITLDNLTDFATLCWCAESIAVVYNYFRLKLIKSTHNELVLGSDYCVSFPNAMRLLEIIEAHSSFENSILSVYSTCQWATPKTVDATNATVRFFNMANTLNEEDRFSVSIEPDQWMLFMDRALSAMNAVSANLDHLNLFPPASREIDSFSFELLFGSLPNGID